MFNRPLTHGNPDTPSEAVQETKSRLKTSMT